MTVVQYEARFTKHSKYAPNMVKTEAKCKRCFLQGLTLKIQDTLTTAQLESYVKAVELAQRVEDSQARVREYRKFQRIRSNMKMDLEENPSREQARLSLEKLEKMSRKRSLEQRHEMDETKKMACMPCRHCEKHNHEEKECWWKMGKCLKCGSSKHRIGEYPIARGNHKYNDVTVGSLIILKASVRRRE